VNEKKVALLGLCMVNHLKGYYWTKVMMYKRGNELATKLLLMFSSNVK